MKKTNGKRLAFLLRHDKDYNFDPKGWRETKDLIQNHGFTLEELKEIVREDEKGRYEWNNELTYDRIRARQGHSVNVDVELEEAVPPDVLYHGTSMRFFNSIMKKGILPMSRLYVQLSDNEETAYEVGKRHGGQTVVLNIDAKKMYEDGIKFYRSRNGVWMTKFVDYGKYGFIESYAS